MIYLDYLIKKSLEPIYQIDAGALTVGKLKTYPKKNPQGVSHA